MMNGLSHHYHLDKSTSILWSSVVIFNGIPLSKQNSPRWNATFCGVPSGAILLHSVPSGAILLHSVASHLGLFCYILWRPIWGYSVTFCGLPSGAILLHSVASHLGLFCYILWRPIWGYSVTFCGVPSGAILLHSVASHLGLFCLPVCPIKTLI